MLSWLIPRVHNIGKVFGITGRHGVQGKIVIQMIVQGRNSSLLISQRAVPECAIYRIIIQSPRQVVCLPPLLRLPTGLPTTAVLPPIFSCRNAR